MSKESSMNLNFSRFVRTRKIIHALNSNDITFIACKDLSLDDDDSVTLLPTLDNQFNGIEQKKRRYERSSYCIYRHNNSVELLQHFQDGAEFHNVSAKKHTVCQFKL